MFTWYSQLLTLSIFDRLTFILHFHSSSTISGMRENSCQKKTNVVGLSLKEWFMSSGPCDSFTRKEDKFYF